jgi:ribonuclease VapC
MIAVDTSAIVAILRLEPEADPLLHAIADAEACFVSAISVLETALVLAGTKGGAAVWKPLDELLAKAQIDVVPFDAEQARHARDAFIRFGKGRHAAALNLGDCASYALAVSRKLPLLFKGDDFTKTDLPAAVSMPPAD